jgi:hypothetical protein
VSETPQRRKRCEKNGVSHNIGFSLHTGSPFV